MRSWFKTKQTAKPVFTLYDDDHAKVTSAWRIYALLERTFDSHCLLKVGIIDDDADAYGSVIVKLGTNYDYLLLDRLTPNNGNIRLTPGCPITISTLLNNLPLRFSSTVVKIAKAHEPAPIRIAFPELVYYAQHRREHRVPIPMNWPLTVSIQLDEENWFGGVVRDLSPSGFRAQLDVALPLPIEHLPFPLPFSLALGNTRIVEGELEICYVYHSEIVNLPRIGTRILRLPPHHQRVLDQCVAEIDRQQSRLR